MQVLVPIKAFGQVGRQHLCQDVWYMYIGAGLESFDEKHTEVHSSDLVTSSQLSINASRSSFYPTTQDHSFSSQAPA